ncbi:helix-turn-helix transcriptional regulator [Clostridium sp. BJN0013]|jgi:transcriptional regulator with XRE-family HTH domain|uniref:helix-turn-helix transcriptional regulator n=1 Tax=Clostridium sp. BJN0013 TaxID=3236840 RepID=UPI0034C604F7
MKRQNLIDARGNKSQLNVSKILGISQKYLSKIELGQRTPSAPLLAKISYYYQQPLEALFPDIFLNKNTPKRRINNQKQII